MQDYRGCTDNDRRKESDLFNELKNDGKISIFHVTSTATIPRIVASYASNRKHPGGAHYVALDDNDCKNVEVGKAPDKKIKDVEVRKEHYETKCLDDGEIVELANIIATKYIESISAKDVTICCENSLTCGFLPKNSVLFLK